MKIVAIDNLAREWVADTLIAENVDQVYAQFLVDCLNEEYSGEMSNIWYVVKEDDYRLSRGMEDLI
jgi:hypothetical protein